MGCLFLVLRFCFIISIMSSKLIHFYNWLGIINRAFNVIRRIWKRQFCFLCIFFPVVKGIEPEISFNPDHIVRLTNNGIYGLGDVMGQLRSAWKSSVGSDGEGWTWG